MMKKFILIFLMLVINSLSYVFGQGVEYRSHNGFLKENYHISLILFEKHYYFDLVYDNSDMCFIVPLSIGRYEKTKGCILTMHDDLNGFDMVMTCENENCIMVENCLCFADSLKLEYYQNTSTEYIAPLRAVDEIKDDSELFHPQTVLYGCPPGKYEIIHPGFFMLDIHDDMTYEYCIDQEIIVSEGVYERHGNLMLFFDNCLGEVFTAIIGDGYILGRYFLGSWRDDKYRIIPEDEYDEYIEITPADQAEMPGGSNLR